MASNRIFAAIILSTILLPTVMAVKCHSTIYPGIESDECELCMVLVKDGKADQGCALPPPGQGLSYFKNGKCTTQDTGSKYYTCDKPLCNACCDDVCGPYGGGKNGSASSQPIFVILGLVGVSRLLH